MGLGVWGLGAYGLSFESVPLTETGTAKVIAGVIVAPC